MGGARAIAGGMNAEGASLLIVGVVVVIIGLGASRAAAQVPQFGGDAQHTSIYTAPAQDLNRIKWQTSIDLGNTGAFAHYGAPLVTAANTVIVPQKLAGNLFQVSAFDGAAGTFKYTLATDYTLPAHNWIPVYNPAVTTGTFGTRLYYAGAGGTVFHVDNPDSNTPGTPVREVFYTTLAAYTANAAGFNSTVFVNTPITADSSGAVYFGFRIDGTAPAPLGSHSGYARIDSNGNTTYVLAGAAAGDGAVFQDSHNAAPALSADGQTLYVLVKGGTFYGYLVGLDATTLATKYTVFLRDPRNNNPAGLPDDSTASPVVAPDGDVYLGVNANPSNARGFLLRFSGDLSVQKTPGAFGWDFTPAIVPSSMVPSYTGASPYLIFTKYNNYANFGDGNGQNRIALLDPNATQLDPHPSASGLVEMREVMTAIGPTPDIGNSNVANAVREWCINVAAVNPATNSVFVPSEDGHIYRWNLLSNSLAEAVALGPGVGEPYVPTIIGPDGTVYTLNGGTMFALGGLSGVAVRVVSSRPDLRKVVAGEAVTFYAIVTGTGPGTPTGTVTFQDVTYQGFTPLTTVLAADVPLDASGHASVTTTALTASQPQFLGNHLITATYSGDVGFSGGSMTLMQKVHARASTTTVTASPSPSAVGQAVTFVAIVSPVPSGGTMPTGMVTFSEGSTVLGQRPLNGAGAAWLKVALSAGSHAVTAVYSSDFLFARSIGTVTTMARSGTITAAPNPIQVCNGTGLGATTLTWTSGGGVTATEVHIGAPDGPRFASSGPNGTKATGTWVSNGMTFYLQDVSGGLPLTPANTLATVVANLTAAGCP